MTRDIVNRILGGPVLEKQDIDGAISFLVKKKYGTKNELIYAVNEGAAQEVVMIALEEGWTPKRFK